LKIALFVLLGLVGLVVAGVLLAGPQLREGLSALAPKPSGIKVRLETAAPRRLVETVKAPGKIEPHTKVEISAEVSARIEALPFREGQQVHRGDVVVRLDDRDLRAGLAAAEARRDGEAFRLQSEQARLTGILSTHAFAKKELERKQQLFDSGDLSRQDLDNAQERVDDLQAQVEAIKHSISVIESSLAGAKADIDQAQQLLAKTVIIAPMDGVITLLNAEIGEVVLVGTMNNPGTVIMTIADLARMILKAEVAETDIARIAVGQPSKVHINAYRDDVYSGTVTQIALQRTDNLDGTGYFETEVEIDLRGGRILSGLIANVDIEIAAHDGVAVESQAIVDRVVEELPDAIKRDNPLVDLAKKTTSVVYTVVNGKATCTPVKRGPSDDTHSVVLAGLSEGEKVVVGPYKVLEKLKHEELVTDEADDEENRSKGEPNSNEKDDGSAVTVSVGA
jgi:HlyD family secretion protein